MVEIKRRDSVYVQEDLYALTNHENRECFKCSFSGTCLLDGVGYPTVKIMGVLS